MNGDGVAGVRFAAAGVGDEVVCCDLRGEGEGGEEGEEEGCEEGNGEIHCTPSGKRVWVGGGGGILVVGEGGL